MKLVYKLLLPLIVIIVVSFTILAMEFIKSEKNLVNDFGQQSKKEIISLLNNQQKDILASEEQYIMFISDMISKIAVTYVYNMEKEQSKVPLSQFLKLQNIQAILVYDKEDGNNFISLYKNNDNKIEYSKKIPKKFNKLKIYKSKMYYIDNDNKIDFGYINLYYDSSIIVDKIKQNKNNVYSNLLKIKNELDLKVNKATTNQVIFLTLIAFTLIVIVFLMTYRVVLEPLKKLNIGLQNFFLFLQNKKDNTKKIIINTNDEFGQMAKSLNENIIVSAKLHEEIYELNVNLEDKIKIKTQEVSRLLNNAGQGFLTFDKSFSIDEEYSNECEKLLGDDIKNKDISAILFNDEDKAKYFKEDILDMLNQKDKVIQRSLLSLLPDQLILNKRALKIEYKILEDDKIMMILTNISAQKKLEKRVLKEQKVLKMIVSVVSDSDIFYDTIKSYKYFCKNIYKNIDKSKIPLKNIQDCFRTIHTFKGAFLQLYMNNTASSLHKVESQLNDLLVLSKEISNDKLEEYLNNIDFIGFMKDDISNINKLLGDKFLEHENFLSLDKRIIKNIENQYEMLLKHNDINDKYSLSLLDDIKYLSQKSLSSQLNPYINLSMQLANKLEKEIYEFEIVGDESICMNDSYKPFIKSLIHVFRNSLDHGIETAERRVELDKDEIGTISCMFNMSNNELQIIIADDGAGIDKDKIISKVDEDISHLGDKEIYQYIFKDNLSTKDEVTDLSGRGVGMSAVKAELEKIHGDVNIESTLNIGTKFIFKIPV